MRQPIHLSRRRFLQTSVTALACVAVRPAFALMRDTNMKSLALRNLHSDDFIAVDYWQNGAYNPHALAKINHLMRDNYSGETHAIDIRLIDLIHEMQQRLGHRGEIEIVSGYRSPYDFAEQSLHATGQAVDLRMQGLPLIELYRTAAALDRGGVGFYPDAHFVHIDVGTSTHC